MCLSVSPSAWVPTPVNQLGHQEDAAAPSSLKVKFVMFALPGVIPPKLLPGSKGVDL